MAGQLSKHRTVLHRIPRPGSDALFSNAEPGDPQPHRDLELVLPEDLWLELGEPDTVTLSLEPGDQLND